MKQWQQKIAAELSRFATAGRSADTVVAEPEIFYVAVRQCLPGPTTPVVVIMPTIAAAEALAADLRSFQQIIAAERPVNVLPEVETSKQQIQPENESERGRLLHMTTRVGGIYVGSIMSVLAPAPEPSVFHNRNLVLAAGTSDWPPQQLAEFLIELDYDNEPEVRIPGEFSWRGGILDLFSPVYEYPIRIDYFGDEIESLRFFDAATQRSIEPITEMRIIPRGDLAIMHSDTSDYCFLDYFNPGSCLLVIGDAEKTETHLEQFGSVRDVKVWERQRRAGNRTIALEDSVTFGGDRNGRVYKCEFYALTPQFRGVLPEADGISDLLARQFLQQQLRRWADDGYSVVVCSDSQSRVERFKEFLDGEHEITHRSVSYEPVDVSCGVIFPKTRIVILSDAEIFGHARKTPTRQRRSAFHADHMIHDENDLREGNLAVHAVYGISRYLGIRQEAFQSQIQEVMVLEFHDDVRVFVPLAQAYLVSRYVGAGKKLPRLSRVAGTRWQKSIQAAKEAVNDIAAELIRVQAIRATQPGFPFIVEEPSQETFDQAFPYTETEDQAKAITEVRIDMERPRPMDRLLCGDVGYGKTEVAMRAAHQAVLCGRQVAVLAPTTILVQQHYLTFRERFREFSILIDCISRFRSLKERNQTIDALRAGKIDIIIGTHSLLGTGVHFKNIGLLIIDEEQRFGVAHKERLKQIRADVDVLTMTATPIPRTLYLSMAGLRDMSTIMTAPLERRPVKTVVAQYDENLIEEAIRREVQRAGQVYYLHNRVRTIKSVFERLTRLVPEASFDVGHGQMDEHTLEATMLRFFKGEIDVLVCTTIIESGLDVPNANTIIIDRADRFGLADLYQLRGRVGRYHRQAYAYLLLPKQQVILDTARERLAAIRKYTQLGVGFKLAMRDLEIRGAGNILGAEQSGHIAAVGFDLYCQLMREAVARMKNQPSPKRIEVDLNIDFLMFGATDDPDCISAYVPRETIVEEEIRLQIYRRFGELKTLAAVDDFADELRDRFGELPAPIGYLLGVSRLKIRAHQAQLHAIVVKGRKVMLEGERGFLKSTASRFPRLSSTRTADMLNELIELVASHVPKAERT